jgi:hypothetical protein
MPLHLRANCYGQTLPSSASADALTIRASADGICYFLGRSTPCVDVGRYLSSNHLAQNGHVDIVVDRALIAAPTLFVLLWLFRKRLTIGSSDHGAASSEDQGEGVDDRDKSASLDGGAAPRRSTSSLGKWLSLRA